MMSIMFPEIMMKMIMTMIMTFRSGLPGKSSPLMDRFAQFSMVGVYETRKGLKFVHITSEKLEGQFTVLIFMDDKLTDLESREWKQFSDEMEQFREAGAQVQCFSTYALHCTSLNCIELHCIALHCTSLHCTALCFTSL